MSDIRVDDLNIESNAPLITPDQLKAKLPLSEKAADSVMKGRQVIRDILDRKDPRLFIVVGPCSIHDPEAAIDYARRLKALQEEVKESLVLVMRVYLRNPALRLAGKV
jgi:3-deoxy-7-phosphoheptulonate synthase